MQSERLRSYSAEIAPQHTACISVLLKTLLSACPTCQETRRLGCPSAACYNSPSPSTRPGFLKFVLAPGAAPCIYHIDYNHNPPSFISLCPGKAHQRRSTYTNSTSISSTYHHLSACSSYQQHYWLSLPSRSLLVLLICQVADNIVHKT